MSLWAKVGSLKSNVGDLAKKTLSNVNKAVAALDDRSNTEGEETTDKSQNSQRSTTEPDDIQQKFNELKTEPPGVSLKPEEEDLNKAKQEKAEEKPKEEGEGKEKTGALNSTRNLNSGKPRLKLGGSGNPLAEFKQMLEEKDQLVNKLAEENDALVKQKNDSQSVIDQLKQEIEKLKQSNKENQQPVANGVVEREEEPQVRDRNIEFPKSETIGDYVKDYISQYKGEFYANAAKRLNNELVHQLELEEGTLPEDAKDLLKTWIAQPGDEEIIASEKIIKPLYEESSLREQVQTLQNTNEELSNKNNELQNNINELKADFERHQGDHSKYQEDIETSYQKYADDIIKYEQTIQDLKDQVAKFDEEMKAKNERIQTLELSQQENEEKVRNFEKRIAEELQQKDDWYQKHENLNEGMKDFEAAMAELNQENQELHSQIKQLKQGATQEKDKFDKLQESIPVGFKNSLLDKIKKLNTLNKEFDFEGLINPKLIVEDNRVYISSLNMALEDSLNIFLDETTRKMTAESDEKRNKEKEKYDNLSKNAIKVQSDLKETKKREREIIAARDKLKEENEELQRKIDNLNSSSNQTTSKVGQLQKTIQDLQDKERKYLEEIAQKNREIEHIIIESASLKDEDTAKNDYISKLEKELAAIPELSTQMETQAHELNNLRELVDAKTDEVETLNTTIIHLQSMIDESHENKEQTFSAHSEDLKNIKQSLEQAEKKAAQLEEFRDKYESMSKSIDSYESQIQELDHKLKESEREKNAVRAEASDLMKKAKSEALNKESLIDKKVITTFLVKYFEPNASFPVKLQILETLSSILHFSEQDRVKLGLHRKRLETHMKEENQANEEEKAGENEANQVDPAISGKSFSSIFKSFLLDSGDK